MAMLTDEVEIAIVMALREWGGRPVSSIALCEAIDKALPGRFAPMTSARDLRAPLQRLLKRRIVVKHDKVGFLNYWQLAEDVARYASEAEAEATEAARAVVAVVARSLRSGASEEVATAQLMADGALWVVAAALTRRAEVASPVRG